MGTPRRDYRAGREGARAPRPLRYAQGFGERDGTVTRRERWLVGIILALSLALPAAGVYWFRVGFREGRASTSLVPYRSATPASAACPPR